MFLDNRPRSRLAVAGLAIATAVEAGNLGLVTLVLTGGRLPVSSSTGQILTALWGLADIGALLFCATTFLLWFHRAYHNAAALGLRQNMSTGWAIGGWFVPVASLFIPGQIASSMWHQAGKQRVGGVEMVIGWWLTWIVGSILVALTSRGLLDLQEGIGTLLMASGHGLRLVAGILAIGMVRKLTRAQEDMHLLARSDEAFGEAPPLPAASGQAAVSTVPGERPVVGSACGACGAAIATAHDAFVCTDCDLPLHEDCLREGACPQCRGRALDSGYQYY